ncbi:PDE12 [Mytilus coruscus]|uniref:PDE12 n=1 Tax=Mytilus coruscus TaxID=42192 RepID=A0A6J8B4V3_MYTCO|nr:PDE12 [Mytilus coruscus]
MKTQQRDFRENCRFTISHFLFRQVEDCSIEIRKAINDDDKYSDIKNTVSSNETLKQEMDTRGTIIQVLVLESVVNPGRKLCVANTHLYFHPIKGMLYQIITDCGHHQALTRCNTETDSRDPDFTLEGASFSHELDLKNSCGIVEYTNYAGNFHEQLDYIFIDSTMDVICVIPMPEHSEVEQHIALPNVVFPSDHIAQICDLKWKSLYE